MIERLVETGLMKGPPFRITPTGRAALNEVRG
jgi:hypothetical protein